MEDELKTNARNLTQATQYEIRKSIIRLSQQGKNTHEIAEILNVSERHVQNTKLNYKNGGMIAIKPGKRGRKSGEKRKLTPEQEKEVQQIIVDKTPEQLKFKECLWTRKAIHELILRKYQIDLPLSTLGLYLQRWGFSVQRPVKRAYQQNKEAVNEWVEETFPGINKRAKEEDAEIYFGDETGLQNTSNYAKGYAPKGKTPVVYTESKHIKINMLSAVSAKGKMRFLLHKESINSDKLIDFMRRLIHDSDKKVFLVLDNLKAHHSKKVSEWIEKHKDEIEIFFLPPYAPEYNPDEYLNNDLKRGIGNFPSPRSEKELIHNVRSHLKKVQLQPEKVKGFYQLPTTKYAAL